MDERGVGLILRTRPLTETSLIVHWLTPELGRLATVAKGARRAKSPFQGKLDLFYLAEFSFARSRRSDLHTLREVSLRETHRGLRQDLRRLQQAAYCAALVEQTTETETPLPGVFALLSDLLGHLSGHPDQAQILFAFELKLLGELGLSPKVEDTALSEGTKRLLEALVVANWHLVPRLKLASAQTSELSRFLYRFLIYHFGKVPVQRSEALGIETE